MYLYHGFRINCTQAPGISKKFSWDAPKRFNKRVIFFDKNKLKKKRRVADQSRTYRAKDKARRKPLRQSPMKINVMVTVFFGYPKPIHCVVSSFFRLAKLLKI